MTISRAPGHVIYSGDDRIEVEVLVNDQWRPGELRSWDQADSGTWSGIVSWSAGPMRNHLDRFPADRIRPVDEARPVSGPAERPQA